MALASVVNILDPDVFIFGGGLSNEIDFFSEIQSKVRKFVAGNEFEGIFLKPKFGMQVVLEVQQGWEEI